MVSSHTLSLVLREHDRPTTPAATRAAAGPVWPPIAPRWPAPGMPQLAARPQRLAGSVVVPVRVCACQSWACSSPHAFLVLALSFCMDGACAVALVGRFFWCLSLSTPLFRCWTPFERGVWTAATTRRSSSPSVSSGRPRGSCVRPLEVSTSSVVSFHFPCSPLSPPTPQSVGLGGLGAVGPPRPVSLTVVGHDGASTASYPPLRRSGVALILPLKTRTIPALAFPSPLRFPPLSARSLEIEIGLPCLKDGQTLQCEVEVVAAKIQSVFTFLRNSPRTSRFS